MQIYPAGDYAENPYGNEDDYDNRYNNHQYPQQGNNHPYPQKGNHHPYPQQGVQMTPDDEWIAPPNPTNRWDEHNPTMEMMPDQWVPHPNHYNKPLNRPMKPEKWAPPPPKQTNKWGHHPNNTDGDNTYINGPPMRPTKHDQWVPQSPSRMPMNPEQWLPPPHESIKGNDPQYFNNNMPMVPDYRGSPPPRQPAMPMRPDQRGPPPPRQPVMPMRPNQRGPPPPRQPVMPMRPNQWGQPPPRQTNPNQWGQPPPKQTDMQRNPEEWAPPLPKHNYHQDMPGYGDSFEGQQYDNWNNNNNSSRNGYPGHGKQVNDYQFAGPMEDDAVDVSGGYGAYQGGQQQPQYPYKQNKGDLTTPKWNAKGVED